MAPRSCASDARLAIRISSSMVSASAPAPVGRYVMISPCGRAFALSSSSACRSSRARTARGSGRGPGPAWMFVRRRCSSYSVRTPSSPGSRSYWATVPTSPPVRVAGDLTERRRGAARPRARARRPRPSRRRGSARRARRPGRAGRARGSSVSIRPRRRSSSTSSSLMRQPRHARRAEEPGEALERVDPAKDVVDELGVRLALLEQLVEHEEVAAEPVDELLGLAEELVARLHFRPVRRLPSSRLRARRRTSADTPSLGSSSPAHVLAELLRGERLRDVGVRAERERAIDVVLAAQRGDDDERRRRCGGPTCG